MSINEIFMIISLSLFIIGWIIILVVLFKNYDKDDENKTQIIRNRSKELLDLIKECDGDITIKNNLSLFYNNKETTTARIEIGSKVIELKITELK